MNVVDFQHSTVVANLLCVGKPTVSSKQERTPKLERDKKEVRKLNYFSSLDGV